jgi:TonB-dependent receptor
VATLDASGNPTGAGAILPGYTDRVSEWRPLATSTVNSAAQSTQKIGKTWNYQVGGVHNFQSLKIDYDAYNSVSDAIYPGNKTFTFNAAGVGLRIERKDEPYKPTITQTGGPDMTKLSSYATNTYAIAAMTGQDEYWGGSINVKQQIQTVVPTYIKVGLREREQTRKNQNTPWTGRYTGVNGVINHAQFLNPDTENVIFDGRYPSLPTPTWPGRDTPGSSYNYTGFNVDTLLRTNPEQFTRNTAADLQTQLTGNTSFKETIKAAYLMGSFDLGKLSVTGGLRVEDTKTKGTGALSGITSEERARRAAFVGTVTEAESIRRTIAEFGGRQTLTGEYRSVFPGLHFKFEPIPRLITRLSYATNVGRPGIGQLIPRTTVNFDSQTIATSNPSLKPQYANNFDLGAEYYFEPAGVVSAGVFIKEIKSFIFTQGGAVVGNGSENGFGGEYAGYQLTTQYNGGFAKLKGFEFNYSQQFTFLPGWLSGFGAYMNYTRMQVEGNYGSGAAIALAPTSEVAGFNPEVGNVGISYIKNKVSIRFQFNHAGRYLVTFNANQSRLIYSPSRDVLDIKTTYQLTRRLGVYLDVSNVFAQGDRVRVYYGGRPNTLLKMGPQFFFGLNGRL